MSQDESMTLADALRHIEEHARQCDEDCARRGFCRGVVVDRNGRRRDMGGRCSLRDIGQILIAAAEELETLRRGQPLPLPGAGEGAGRMSSDDGAHHAP